VTAIALVDVDAPDRVPLDVGDGAFQRVAVEGIAVQRFGVQDELAALGLGDGDSNRHLAAELVGRPSLALADTLDLGACSE
jgi:hypothetical protein